mmetsp:Transcript_27759/g.85165  ORF Transcript_27759/g.85165 Transcript_27759/m.85165 type:complete len:205 (-) Transcript_27759:145-759(-)
MPLGPMESTLAAATLFWGARRAATDKSSVWKSFELRIARVSRHAFDRSASYLGGSTHHQGFSGATASYTRNLADVIAFVFSSVSSRSFRKRSSSAEDRSSSWMFWMMHSSKPSSFTTHFTGKFSGTSSDTQRSSSHDTTCISTKSSLTSSTCTSLIVEISTCDSRDPSRDKLSRHSTRSLSETVAAHIVGVVRLVLVLVSGKVV